MNHKDKIAIEKIMLESHGEQQPDFVILPHTSIKP